MPTVDDLVISLTIKETSKLGQLQKQLEAIVGKKGQKAPILGLDQETKNTISYIKKRMMFILPTHIPDKSRPYAMSETARILSATLEENIRAYAIKMVPHRPDVFEATKREFGVETRPELVEALEAKIRDWRLRLEDVQRREFVGDAAQKFLANISDLVKRVTIPQGWTKTLMTNIDNAVGERNREIAELLEGLGFTVKPEQYMARIKQERLQAAFPKGGRKFFRENMEHLKKAFNITSRENSIKLNNLEENSRKWTGGTAEAMEKLAVEFGIPLKDLWNITDKEVAKSEDLRTIGATLTIMMEQAKRTGAPSGIPLGLEQIILDGLKKIRFGDVSKLSEERRFIMEARINKTMGKGIRQFFERYRIDFLLTNIQKDIKKVEALFGKEIADQLVNVDSLFAEQKKILSEANRGQFRTYDELVGFKRLIGVGTQVLESFTDLFPNILTKRLNIATESLSAGLREKLTDIQIEELQQEADNNIILENLKSFLEELQRDVPSESITDEYILEKIQEMKKHLGINPNSIDLPKFLTDIGNELFKIGKEVRDIKTKEGRELSNEFLNKAKDIFIDLLGKKKGKVQLGSALWKVEELEKNLHKSPETAVSGEIPLAQKLSTLLKSMWDYKSAMAPTAPYESHKDETIQDTLARIRAEPITSDTIEEGVEHGLKIWKVEQVDFIARLIGNSEILKDLKGDMSNQELNNWMINNLGNIKDFIKTGSKLDTIIVELNRMADIFKMPKAQREKLFRGF